MKKYLWAMLAVMLLLTGCASDKQKISEPVQTAEAVDHQLFTQWQNDLAAIAAQSESIKSSLENDPLNQMELNLKAQELYVLWDDALNRLWGDLERSLPEDVFVALLQEQLVWIDDKEAAMEEAGQLYEGGSIYPLIIYTEGANITEARVYALYELLR